MAATAHHAEGERDTTQRSHVRITFGCKIWQLRDQTLVFTSDFGLRLLAAAHRLCELNYLRAVGNLPPSLCARRATPSSRLPRVRITYIGRGGRGVIRFHQFAALRKCAAIIAQWKR